MAEYVQELDLNVDKPNLFRTGVYAKQGDHLSRYVCVTLKCKGETLTIPTGASAKIRALKPDGTGVFNPCVIDVQNNTITAELTDQMLAVEGTVTADIMLIGANDEILSTALFQIEVTHIPGGEVIQSSDEFLELIELRGEVNAALAAAEAVATVYKYVELLPENWLGDSAPYTCTVAAEGMTPTKKVIVGLAADADANMRSASRAAILTCVAQGEGTLSFVADGDKPLVALPIIIREEGT